MEDTYDKQDEDKIYRDEGHSNSDYNGLIN